MTRADEGNKGAAQAQETSNSKILYWRQSRSVRREDPVGVHYSDDRFGPLSRARMNRPLRQEPQKPLTCSKMWTRDLLPI